MYKELSVKVKIEELKEQMAKNTEIGNQINSLIKMLKNQR